MLYEYVLRMIYEYRIDMLLMNINMLPTNHQHAINMLSLFNASAMRHQYAIGTLSI